MFTEPRIMVGISLTRSDVDRLRSIADTLYKTDAIADKILREVLKALPPEPKVERIVYESIWKHLIGRRLVRSDRDELLSPSVINAIRWSAIGNTERLEVQGQNFSWLVHPGGWIEVEA